MGKPKAKSKSKDEDEYENLIREIEENLKFGDKNDISAEDDTVENEQVEYEFIPGFRATSNLIWIEAEQQIYKRNSHSVNHNGMAYSCYDTKCQARLVITDDTKELIKIKSTHSAHISMLKTYKEMYYYNKMKQMCETEPHSVTIQNVYSRVQKM